MKAAPIRTLSTMMRAKERGKVLSTVLFKPSITPLLSAPKQTRQRETKTHDSILIDHFISHTYIIGSTYRFGVKELYFLFLVLLSVL